MDNDKNNKELTSIRERVEKALKKIAPQERTKIEKNGEIMSRYAGCVKGGVAYVAPIIEVDENTWTAMQIGSNSSIEAILRVSRKIKENIPSEMADRMATEEVINWINGDKKRLKRIAENLLFFAENNKLPNL